MVKPSLFDQWNLLKVYTPRKAWNLFLLFLSFRFKKVWGLPNSFAIEPTTSCNLRCPECPSGLRSFTRNTGHLDVERVKHYIDEYSASATYLTFYFQGEPFLNPNFLDMIKYGKTKKTIYRHFDKRTLFNKGEIIRNCSEWIGSLDC